LFVAITSKNHIVAKCFWFFFVKRLYIFVKDIEGAILSISQFTLFADTKKGNRPSYIRAARPEKAIPLYEAFVQQLQALTQKPVATGVFGADMQVSLCNDGPVTIFIDSKMRDF